MLRKKPLNPRKGPMDIARIAQEVLQFVAAEKIELAEDLNAAEQVLRDQVLRSGDRAMEWDLAGKRLAYEAASPACPGKANPKFGGSAQETRRRCGGP